MAQILNNFIHNNISWILNIHNNKKKKKKKDKKLTNKKMQNATNPLNSFLVETFII